MNFTNTTCLLAAIAIVGTASTTQAQKLDASKVPATVKTAFTKKYPHVDNVKWEKEDGNFEAGFKENNQSMSTIFTPDGTLVESEVSIPVTSLPAAVTSYMKDHYKNVTVKEAAKITKASGEINYEAEIKGKDVIFDANGKFLKEAKD
jgi:hypothetical protein